MTEPDSDLRITDLDVLRKLFISSAKSSLYDTVDEEEHSKCLQKLLNRLYRHEILLSVTCWNKFQNAHNVCSGLAASMKLTQLFSARDRDVQTLSALTRREGTSGAGVECPTRREGTSAQSLSATHREGASGTVLEYAISREGTSGAVSLSVNSPRRNKAAQSLSVQLAEKEQAAQSLSVNSPRRNKRRSRWAQLTEKEQAAQSLSVNSQRRNKRHRR